MRRALQAKDHRSSPNLSRESVPADYYDTKKVKGHVDIYRVRIGDFRVIYEIKWDDRQVNVLLVERREVAYKGL